MLTWAAHRALPYLGYLAADDPLYVRTRAFLLSRDNPWFIQVRASAGRASNGR